MMRKERLVTLTRLFGSEVMQKGTVIQEITKTKQAAMSNKRREVITETSEGFHFVYGWIEFPAWAAKLPQLSSAIDSACRLAMECERHDNTIRLSHKSSNGRYMSLESLFRTHLIPFDCGGEDPIDNTQWEGWWRPGSRRLVISEIASSGEKFVPISELQSVIKKYHGDALHEALMVLITQYECTPPMTLRETEAPVRL